MIAASNFVNQMHNGGATTTTSTTTATLGNVENNKNDNNNSSTTTTTSSSLISDHQHSRIIDYGQDNSIHNTNNNDTNDTNNIMNCQNDINNSEEQILNNNIDNCEIEHLNNNDNDNENVDEDPIDITISNVVTNFSVRCHLNLRQIACRGSNVVYKREQSIILMKLRRPHVTASIWSSGKITCTGATTEEQAKSASRKVARCLQRLGFRVKFSSYRIVNVLGACRLPFGVKIHEFSSKHRTNASYEPELHPGATYRIKELKAVLKIFQTGSITITAPSIRNVQLAVESVYPLVYEFQKPKPKTMKINNKNKNIHHYNNLNINNNNKFNAFKYGVGDEDEEQMDDDVDVDEILPDEAILIKNIDNDDDSDSDSD